MAMEDAASRDRMNPMNQEENSWTGEELYAKWARKMAQQGIDVDPWDDIDEPERFAWQGLAIELMP